MPTVAGIGRSTRWSCPFSLDFRKYTFACVGGRQNFCVNMATRGVWQLTRLAFNTCNHSGSSRGARVFLDEYLPHFAKEHPHIEVTTTVTPGRHPSVRGDYMNGTSRSVGLKSEEPGEILRQVMNLRSTIGRRTSTGTKANRSVKQRVVTTTPSIQRG